MRETKRILTVENSLWLQGYQERPNLYPIKSASYKTEIKEPVGYGTRITDMSQTNSNGNELQPGLKDLRSDLICILQDKEASSKHPAGYFLNPRLDSVGWQSKKDGGWEERMQGGGKEEGKKG